MSKEIMDKLTEFLNNEVDNINPNLELDRDEVLKLSMLVIKADKWNKLNEKVDKFYDEDNTEYYDEMGLVSIGEICASHLGYL